METPPPLAPRVQFTIARLLACTALFALAALVATAKLPFGLTLASSSFAALGEVDVLPIVGATFFAAIAIGVLLQGTPILKESGRFGCALLLLAIALVPIVLMFQSLARWLW
jgi:hypothetical protein